MTLHIEGIREQVLSDRTAPLLSELLKFRHFRRYYFEFEYDWDRIDFLRKKLEQARPVVERDLDRGSENFNESNRRPGAEGILPARFRLHPPEAFAQV
jgi:hypothetical protein